MLRTSHSDEVVRDRPDAKVILLPSAKECCFGNQHGIANTTT
jgi:hypothetical protein